MNTVDYLRISLIDRCNFRCTYCMPEGSEVEYIQAQESLTNTELIALLKEVFIPLGFKKIRLTGGEPLLRRDLVSLVDAIANLAGVEDLSMTTNGFLLNELAQPLYDAGLRRINISLDSLDHNVFRQITGRDTWEKVWAGILAAYEVGFNPLKLNVVVVPEVNDREILDLAALSIDRHWHVRFIEFMPIGNDNLFTHKRWVDSVTLRQQISDRYGLETGNCKGNGPADIFQIPNAKGTLGFISQMSECFCDHCNRMRLSADGLLRPCLLNESGQIDLKSLLRQGKDFAELRVAVRDLLQLKDEINFKDRDRGTGEQKSYFRTMSQIGG
ncbi:GTP 3',8-cyclase MoaA [Pseudanabaena mucicola]|uniref:GTP 3',8-cyclase n=1 Tax=Pseudanabaena mucicola FACHB-723 TaxID=2692860 RepID=A0ABR7ZUC6_9CYAN|nr:GTP 3',8-cyclase MoaA [Pseudanabaena mucicola]MBD2187382.1 GTP 3',8-cyclase MoaA [Pseudanabaena mucicola FACHB-723]